MYNLKMKLGEVKGSGADGNVYIQLFGSKGNTAKIQLRQAGDEKNQFETGQEYKFIVTTLDIGKVQCTLYMYLMIRLQAQGLYEFQSTYKILQHKTVRALEPWTLHIFLYIFFSDHRMQALPCNKSIY